MPHLTISQKTACRFLLTKQLLWPPQNLKGLNGIAAVFNTLRAIQYDPLNPCGNNVDLVLQSRVRVIHLSDYYHWLYTERRGVEHFDKALTIFPIEDTSLLRRPVEDWVQRFIGEHRNDLDKLLQQIKEEGPVRAADVQDNRRIDWGWGPARWAKAALEVLWMNWELVISHRKGTQRYYDLPEEVYGQNLCPKTFPENFERSKHILRRMQAVGLLPTKGNRQGWQGIGKSREIRPAILDLIQDNSLSKVYIEGISESWVILKRDEPLLTKLEESTIQPKLAFLAPLDNLLWDRKLMSDIFGFDYSWEVYIPKAKRKYGYYVLPMLYGDRFIGRIEPVLNNDTELEIKGFWLEDKTEWNAQIRDAFQSCLKQFMKYSRAKKLKWSCKEPD
jgi:uncharacterized protein YcaQ